MADERGHFEPYVHLAGLTDQRALLSWGGFFFRPGASGGATAAANIGENEWMVVDDQNIGAMAPGRRDSIGERSRTYGPAEVDVFDARGRRVARQRADGRNHVWIEGLAPDTTYRYAIRVEGKDWLAGDRYDWGEKNGKRGLHRSGRSYDCRFRTHPSAEQSAALAFAALGDYGVGIRSVHDDAWRQRRIARALERAADRYGIRLVLTLGDNVYLGKARTGATGDEDDDWFFTFYQPYRYLLSRIPFYPTVGNHDASDTEKSDDRDQLNDNFFLRQRFAEKLEADRASLDPGLFYSFRYGRDVEFVCIDTTREGDRFFQRDQSLAFLQDALPEQPGDRRWRIPFSHHPVYCAGPEHGNTEDMERVLVPLFRRAGVRLVLAGHEHNFQHARTGGIHYFVTGAGGKLRSEPPQRFAAAHTVDYAVREHLVVVELDGGRAQVSALTAEDDDGTLTALERRTPDGERRSGPITIALR